VWSHRQAPDARGHQLGALLGIQRIGPAFDGLK
jgi:hypothetical protein